MRNSITHDRFSGCGLRVPGWSKFFDTHIFDQPATRNSQPA